MARIAVFVCLASVIALLPLGGCGTKSGDDAPTSSAEFKSLVTLYSMAVKYGYPPTSEENFKSSIKGRMAPAVTALKLTDTDALFTSKRDGKPVVLVYGKRPPGMDPGVVAYEQVGLDGKRLVGFERGMVEEADETRFRELVPDAAKAP